MEGAVLTEGLQQETHPLSSGTFTAIPCGQRPMWVPGQAGSCRGSGGRWLQCLGRRPRAGPRARGPASRGGEGRGFSTKRREHNFPLPQSKKDPGGVGDEGNSLLIKTNLDQGNNELGPKDKRLASKHRDVRYRFGGFSVMFFPVLEAVSKRRISASSLQSFLLLPPALGREIAPSARPQYHLPPPKGQALSLLLSFLIVVFGASFCLPQGVLPLKPHPLSASPGRSSLPPCSPDTAPGPEQPNLGAFGAGFLPRFITNM